MYAAPGQAVQCMLSIGSCQCTSAKFICSMFSSTNHIVMCGDSRRSGSSSSSCRFNTNRSLHSRKQNPTHCDTVVQVLLAGGAEQFNDPTATLLLQIDCIERDSLELRCVGYAVIPLFVDPREETQPRRKNLLDYILNQVPLPPLILTQAKGKTSWVTSSSLITPNDILCFIAFLLVGCPSTCLGPSLPQAITAVGPADMHWKC